MPDYYNGVYVALFVSAWIEIKRDLCLLLFGTVALFVSAWIEINVSEYY